MPIGYSRPGPDNVSAYRMSGIPYLTASTLQRGDVIQVNLPYVSKFIKITNNETQSGTKIAFGVSASAHTLGNEFINIASGQTETFNVATKVFFLSNSAGNTTNGSLQFQACAGLTFIDEYPLWGDGVGTLVAAPAPSFANAYSADFGGGSTNVYVSGSDMSGTLNGARRATFSSWVKSDATWGVGTNDLVCARSRNKAGSADNQFFFRIGTGGSNHHAQLSLGTSPTLQAETSIHSASLFTADTWHHILWVYNGDQAAGSRVQGYVNGVQRTANVTGTQPATIRSSSAVWLFGLATFNTKANPFGPGNIDEFAVWTDMALSQSQINEIYNAGDPPDLNALATTPTPAYWFRMGDNSSDTASQLANVNGSERFVVCRPTGSSAIWVQDVP